MNTDLYNIINESLIDEVKRTILEEKESGKQVFHITCEGEPVQTCYSEEDANRHLDIYKKKHPEKEFIIEKTTYNSYSEMIDKFEELGEKLELKETKTMEKKSIKVKNMAQAVLDAKEKGLKEFKLGTEIVNVDEAWKQLEEEEGTCEECNMEEELTGDQHKLDVDKDGDIGADDLADLRAGKKGDVNEGIPLFLPAIIKGLRDELGREPSHEEVGKEVMKMFGKHEDDKKDDKKKKEKEGDVDEGGAYIIGSDGKPIEWTRGMKISAFSLPDSQNDDDLGRDSHEKNTKEVMKMFGKHQKEKEVNEGHGECNECGSMLNEEGVCNECGAPMNESKKTKLRLSESELVSLISRIVNESVPGLEVTKKAQKISGSDSKSHMADVEKKLKEVSSFDGNDNPEFPNAIGKGGTVAQRTSDDENETIDDFRGGGLEDLNYQYEPSKRFKARLKKALEGDSTMGNSQDAANVVKSELGEKIGKKIERKAKKIAKEPEISWGHSWKEPEKVNVVQESTKPTMSSVLEEEIKRMKKILGYDERTQ